MAVRFTIAVFCLALGCSGGDASLRVDLRTDFVPGVEFTSVRTLVDEAESETRMFAIADELFEAGRVASFDSIAPGERRIRVTLIGPAGEVASRSVRVQVAGDVGITVLMTRDCRGVACPGAGDDISALSCLGGACVPEDCVDGSSPECPEPECGVATECTAVAFCAAAECVEGVCVYRRDDTQCGADEYCDPDEGCLPVDISLDGGTDASMSDVGFDGGTDAGPDSGPDAPDMWMDPAATNRMVIDVPGTGRFPLMEVPILVRLTPARIDYTSVAVDGSDIRFFSEGVLLAHEIERFNDAGSSWIWVGVPLVDVGPSSFTMYWGGSSLASRPTIEVWTPEFVAVHHMDDDRDSTVNANHTGWVGVSPGAGALGPNAIFNAGDLSHMRMPPSATLAALDQMTLSAVVRHRADQLLWRSVMARQTGATWSNDLWLGFFDNLHRSTVSTVGGPPGGVNLTGLARTLDLPILLVVTFDGRFARMYVDGVQVASTAIGGTLLSSPNPIWIGADANTDPTIPDTDFIEADIDELRIERVARPPEWIELQNRVLRDTLLTYGPAETR